MTLFHSETPLRSAKSDLVRSGEMRFCRAEKRFGCSQRSLRHAADPISKPLETTAKGFETMPKDFGKRSSPSIHEESCQFDRVAP